jgi:type I restriction enzyme S subunit
MEEWKTFRIGDICESVSDTYRRGSASVVLVNTSDVLDGVCLNHTRVQNKDLKGQFKKTFKKDDILYSEIRPANKRFAYIDFDPIDYIASTKLMVIRSSDKVRPRYLYHFLKRQEMLDELQALAESRSGTFPQITFSELALFEIKLPSLETQDRIVAAIDSFEYKIALNNRINHNLEEQARSLYKSWFIDFEPFKDGKFVDSELGMIPEGWHIGTLSEIADITMGQSPSGSSFNEDGHGIVFYQGRTEFGFRFPSIKLFTTEPTRFAEPHSVLVSVRAPVGDINVALDRCCIGRGLAAITAKDEAFSFVLYTLKGKSSELDLYNGEGTVFGSINRKDLEGLSVLIPPMSIIQQFNDCIRPIDESIEIACKEIVNLSFSRDSLLPRLMSGQLSFDECDC